MKMYITFDHVLNEKDRAIYNKLLDFLTRSLDSSPEYIANTDKNDDSKLFVYSFDDVNIFVGGRPSVLDDEKKAAIVEMRDDKKTYSEIARELGISRSTVRNYYIRFLDESTDA